MQTKNIFKTLALAMLMPTMLLTTACSSEDDVVNNNIANLETVANKGYALPVTVNVTREGDKGSNRASYNDNGDGTGSLAFGTGDKLFVEGWKSGPGQFAGTLTWVSGTTFTGTITTGNEYTGTADELFSGASPVSATLLPADYGTYSYLSIWGTYEHSKTIQINKNKPFATLKATAVEQFSKEQATSYSSGFALSPQNAILNFTIIGLTASTDVDVALTGPSSLNITGSATTDVSGNATFAVGVEGGTDLNDLSLTVAGNPIILVSSDKMLAAGKIYNITRCVNAINGQFSVSSTKKVFFSKGNLQATTTDLGATWTWAFAANQWSYVGNAAANTSMKTDGKGTVTANGTVDLFGWVGASSSWTSAAKWGISASNTSADYGNVDDEALKSDWGNVPGIGTGWRTLTGGDTDREWNYLFNTRSASTVNGVNDARYAKAIVNGVNGIVLFPDSYTHPTGVTAPNSINSYNISFANAHNTWSGDDWTKMEKAGCVFLPAGGYRNGTAMTSVGLGGYYWTSTSSEGYAYRVFYTMSTVNTSTSTNYRYSGYSVRLVHDAN